MTGAAAAALNPHLAGPQIDLVMYDKDFTGQELIKSRRLADRLARRIHKGLRLQQQDALAVDRSLAKLTFKATAKSWVAMSAGNYFDRHKADIVPVLGVTRTGIAETDDEAHHQPNDVSKEPRSTCSARRGLKLGRRRRRCGCRRLLAHSRRSGDAGDRKIAFRDRRAATFRYDHPADMDALSDIEPIEFNDQMVGNAIYGTA